MSTGKGCVGELPWQRAARIEQVRRRATAVCFLVYVLGQDGCGCGVVYLPLDRTFLEHVALETKGEFKNSKQQRRRLTTNNSYGGVPVVVINEKSCYRLLLLLLECQGAATACCSSPLLE